MSMKAIVEDWESRRHNHDKTGGETPMKQVKQAVSAFHQDDRVSSPMKHRNPQKTAENTACFTVSPPKERNSETPLSDDLLAGLRRLASGRIPTGVDRVVWLQIAADAKRLAEDGWAATALAMGWTAEQLFGVDDDDRGVAVELQGRPIRALLAEGDAPGARAIFILDGGNGARVCVSRASGPARLLWEM